MSPRANLVEDDWDITLVGGPHDWTHQRVTTSGPPLKEVVVRRALNLTTGMGDRDVYDYYTLASVDEWSHAAVYTYQETDS